MHRPKDRQPYAHPDLADAYCVPLTHGRTSVIDAADLPIVAPFVWTWDRCRKGLSNGRAYRLHRPGGRRTKATPVYLSRLLAGATCRYQLVRFANGDSLDNRRSNLIVYDATESNRRRHKLTRRACYSRFKGVSRNLKGAAGWQAGIVVDYRRINLGTFHSETAAARAYDRAARDVFPDSRRVNFPDDEEEGVRLDSDPVLS